jgi:hypothetical protein
MDSNSPLRFRQDDAPCEPRLHCAVDCTLTNTRARAARLCDRDKTRPGNTTVGFPPPMIKVPGPLTNISPLELGPSNAIRGVIKRSCRPSLSRSQLRTGPVSRWMKPERGYQPTPHRTRDSHRVRMVGGEPHVKRTTVKMLTVFGNSEGCMSQHRVGFGCAKGRQHDSSGLAGSGHDVGEKVDDANIDVGHPAGMLIAQEDAQLVHHLCDWAIRIAIDAIEGRPRMGIEKS